MLRYPNKYVQVGKMFANPELMSEENLQLFTGKQTVNGSTILAVSFYKKCRAIYETNTLLQCHACLSILYRFFKGLTAKDYWTLVDDLINSGLRPGRKLSFAAQVLLHLVKIRKGEINFDPCLALVRDVSNVKEMKVLFGKENGKVLVY